MRGFRSIVGIARRLGITEEDGRTLMQLPYAEARMPVAIAEDWREWGVQPRGQQLRWGWRIRTTGAAIGQLSAVMFEARQRAFLIDYMDITPLVTTALTMFGRSTVVPTVIGQTPTPTLLEGSNAEIPGGVAQGAGGILLESTGTHGLVNPIPGSFGWEEFAGVAANRGVRFPPLLLLPSERVYWVHTVQNENVQVAFSAIEFTELPDVTVPLQRGRIV